MYKVISSILTAFLKRRATVFLAELILFVSITRLYLLGVVPPHASLAVSDRFISAIFSIGSTIILFFLTDTLLKKKKLSLLISWIFAVLPWTFEQGRIISQPNNCVFYLLLILFLIISVDSLYAKIVLVFLFPVIIHISYPQIWLEKSHILPTVHDFLNNFFLLTSPDLLFFKNTTFWWGGVKGFGVMYVTLLPFFLLGVIQTINRKEYRLPAILALLITTAALSTYLPESRELFLATPIFSFMIARGLYGFYSNHRKLPIGITILLIVCITYEMAQFMHYYFIHYPLYIQGNINQIKDAF